MNRRAISWMCVVVTTIVIATWPAAGRPAEDSASVRQKFVGTWMLVSTEEKLKDGTARPYEDLGPKALGNLMYAADGHMCAGLMRPDRPKWDEPPTAEQKIAAIEGFTAYCGRYEIDVANHVMWHYPELAWKPNYVGTKQARPYRFDGDRLVFSDKALPEDKAEVVQWTIVWERVK